LNARAGGGYVAAGYLGGLKLKISDKVMAWLGPAAISAVAAILIFGNPVSREALCAGEGNCLATWVDALSGWAAAVAAAVTIRSLYRQASSQQKQTDFQLGDADPTVDAVQHTDQRDRVIIRIRNWNRRSMIVRRLRLVTPTRVKTMAIAFPKSKQAALHPYIDHGWIFARGNAKRFDPAIMIEGWVKREEEPPLLKLSLSAFLPGRRQVRNEWKDFPVEIQYELVGIREVFRVTAHVHLAATAVEANEAYEIPEIAEAGEGGA
jgi:hypothetical protein